MHIENDKLVGSYVSEVYPENGAITINIVDGDSTPTREFTRYKYVQTPQLTELGIAVKDYGSIIIPISVIDMITNHEIDGEDFGVIVDFNGVKYGISISDILALAPEEAIEFSPVTVDTFIGAIFGAEIPPFNSEDADCVLKVVDGKLQWVKPEEPITYYVATPFTDKVVITYPGTTTPVPISDFDRSLPIRGMNAGHEYDILYPLGVDGSLTYSTPVSYSGEVLVRVFVTDVANNIIKLDNSANIKCVPTYQTTDKNKVLTVNSAGNGIEWKAIPTELPTINGGDAGKVLKVNSGETGVEWGTTGGLVVHINEVGGVPTMDKTWQEIYNVFSVGGNVVIASGNSLFPPSGVAYVLQPDLYSVTFFDTSINSQRVFLATNPNDYLVED